MPVDNSDKRYDVLTYRCIVQNRTCVRFVLKPACVRETSLFTHSVYRKLDRGCRICQKDKSYETFMFLIAVKKTKKTINNVLRIAIHIILLNSGI